MITFLASGRKIVYDASNMAETLRLAIICGSRETRNFLEREFTKLAGFDVVYKGQDLKTNFKKMVRLKPEVVLLATGSPNTFFYELPLPKLVGKIKRRLPETKMILFTELEQNHPYIREAIEGGNSVIDERADIFQIGEVLRQAKNGKQVIFYLDPRKHDLETYRPSRKEVR